MLAKSNSFSNVTKLYSVQNEFIIFEILGLGSTINYEDKHVSLVFIAVEIQVF